MDADRLIANRESLAAVGRPLQFIYGRDGVIFERDSEWGWDEKGRRYISTVQDSTGGIRLFYSPGFSDSKLVWDGRALGNPAARAEQFEFEKTGPIVFTVSYSFRQNGKWQVVDKSTCPRK